MCMDKNIAYHYRMERLFLLKEHLNTIDTRIHVSKVCIWFDRIDIISALIGSSFSYFLSFWEYVKIQKYRWNCFHCLLDWNYGILEPEIIIYRPNENGQFDSVDSDQLNASNRTNFKEAENPVKIDLFISPGWSKKFICNFYNT